MASGCGRRALVETSRLSATQTVHTYQDSVRQGAW